MPSNTLQTHPNQNAGENLIKRDWIDEKGQHLIEYEREVDSKLPADFTQVEGVLGQEVFNERNRRRSRLSETHVMLGDPFVHKTRLENEAKQMGGTRVVTSFSTESAVGGLPAPTENDLTLLESKVEHNGRAHCDRTDTRVEGWEQFVAKDVRKHPDATGARLQELRKVVAPGTPLPSGASVLESHHERIDDEKMMEVQKFAPDGFGTLQNVDKLDPDVFGDELTTNTKIVDLPFTMPAATFKTVASQLTDLGTGKGKYVRADVGTWEDFDDEEEETQTGLQVLVKRRIIDRASPPAITYGAPRFNESVKWLDKYKGLRVQREIDADVLTSSWTEFHNVRYYFPAYLDPTNPFGLVDDGQGNWTIVPNKSSDVSVSVPARFLITYHTTAQVPEEVFQFKPVDLKLYAPGYTLNEQDLITDAGNLAFTVQMDGSYFHISWAIPASSPTASDYLNTVMGSEQLIADDSIRWKFNLYRRTRVYITIPDFDLGLGVSLSYY